VCCAHPDVLRVAVAHLTKCRTARGGFRSAGDSGFHGVNAQSIYIRLSTRHCILPGGLQPTMVYSAMGNASSSAKYSAYRSCNFATSARASADPSACRASHTLRHNARNLSDSCDHPKWSAMSVSSCVNRDDHCGRPASQLPRGRVGLRVGAQSAEPSPQPRSQDTISRAD
jgi:hypothetical protein